MNHLAVIIALLTATPARAEWKRVGDDLAANRFVETAGRIWALPEMAFSRDSGLSWAVNVSGSDSNDVDIGPNGSEASLDRQGFLILENPLGGEAPQSSASVPWLCCIRFLARRILGVGSWRNADDAGYHAFLSSEDGRSWAKTEAGPFDEAPELFVLDRKHAWIAGAGPGGTVVWRTTDGGRRWDKAAGRGEDVEGIFFLDHQRGWMTVSPRTQSEILVTRDGGKTWTTLARVDSSSTPVKAIAFADAKRGWIAAPGLLWSTRDGGRTWIAEVDVDDDAVEPAEFRHAKPVTGFCR